MNELTRTLRLSGRLRPTVLTVIVFVYLVTAWTFTMGPDAWSATVLPNNDLNSRLDLGLVPVATLMQHRTAAGWTWSLEVYWLTAVVVLIVSYLVSRATAFAIDRCVRGTVSPLAVPARLFVASIVGLNRRMRSV